MGVHAIEHPDLGREQQGLLQALQKFSRELQQQGLHLAGIHPHQVVAQLKQGLFPRTHAHR
jgi:hypothetical protein